MRAILLLVLMSCASWTIAQQRPPEIDPNTKIEGGADVRKSGAGAGASTRDDKVEAPQRRDEPEKKSEEQDKPTSERKPRERDDRSEREADTPRSPGK